MKSIHLKGKSLGNGVTPLICTPLVGRTAEAIDAELAAILPKEPDVLEWRVDFFANIANTDQVIAVAQQIKQRAGAIPLLFTCRSSLEGGEKITLNAEQIVQMYEAVCQSRQIDLIDFELCNDAAHMTRVREVSKANQIALVMSYHNFQQTPDEATLSAKFTAAERLGADVAKIAVMPTAREDVLRLMAASIAADQASKIPTISMSMGRVGVISRMFGWVYGSTLTFAVGKNSSAPGQISIEELRAVLALAQRVIAP